MGWKLVRDKNEEWCRAHGVSGQWRVSPDRAASLRSPVATSSSSPGARSHRRPTGRD